MTAKTNTHQGADPVYEAAADGFEAGYDKAAPLSAWLGRRHRRIDRLDRQLQRFVDREKARRPRRWVFAFEIAELAASEAGSIESKREKQRLVYAELARAVAAGDFETGGGRAVRWLPEASRIMKYLARPQFRLTPIRFANLARRFGDDPAATFENPEFQKDVTAQLSLLVGVYRQWLGDNDRPDLPPKFRAEGEIDALASTLEADEQRATAAVPQAPEPPAEVVQRQEHRGGPETPPLAQGQPSAKRGRGRGLYYGQLLTLFRALGDAEWQKVEVMSGRARARMIKEQTGMLKLSGLPKSPTARRAGVEAAWKQVGKERQRQKQESEH